MDKWSPSSFLLVIATFGLCAQTALCADKQSVLQAAQSAYYGLKSEGLAGFTCEAVPDFDAAFSAVRTDEVGKGQVLPAARKIKFQVLVGPSGASLVSQQFAEAPASEDLATRLRSVASGMNQMLTGFFQTWSQLMVNSPVPGSADDYQMEELSDGYRLTADQAKSHVSISMNADYVINSLQAKTPDLEGVVRPHFSKQEGKFILDGYDAVYKTTNGTQQQLAVKIQYQRVQGFSLPKIVTMTVPLQQGRVEEPIVFSDCSVQKR